ncbi:phosphate transporter PHO1-like isoform X2 [Macadamia integrifolia]|uniref:phosphate transporter PHO1-like isoform X2 n=1 Tax=Macadamia integrifolia TaxID=60698 RepID=UPI001C4EBC3E|nr:phosphate transporter PHO1-like isoform X2 [Macadamia integrifolia]
MVKFSKLLEAQLIPEWKDAFVNYWLLKKNVKKIKLSRNSKLLEIQKEHEYGFSILDPIRCIVKKLSNRFDSGGKNSEILQVKNSNRGGGDDEDVYQTELVQLFSEEDEVKEFFMKLDEELNKVNQFYKTREREFVERGEILNKQLQILLDLKKILNDRRQRDIQSKLDSGTLERSNSSGRCSDCSESAGELDETSSEGPSPDEVMVAIERNRVNFIGATTRTKTKKGKPKMAMRIDKTAATLTSSISSITSMLWEDLITNPKKESLGVVGDLINEKKIQSAEKMIRGAFVELYKGLGLLKTYSSLNMLAFTKILKKFDKVANQQASDNYLKVVKRSHFISSDKVVRLTDEVESIFTKYFASNDRKKAMKFLRPQLQKDSHMVTFFTGIFTGGFVTLFGVYAILAHLSGIFSDGGYMETIYPVFSMFALLSLHMFMYGSNLFMWKNTRINYNFIFEFSPTTALKYRDAFLICTSLMTAVVGAMVIHLLLRSTSFSSTQVDAIPGVLFLFFIGLLICPFNIFYRSTRYYFIRVIRNIISSPFCKVIMVDFFMADQLTSQIPLLRHMESTACYLLAGSFETHRYEICHSSKLYRELAYVISFAPYYWRAMQCARRWFDEGDVNHLANLGKYVSAMVAAGARLTFGMQPTLLWKVIVIATSSIATIYQLYWDFVKDWGFLNPKSKNPWLRDELILKNKSIYYVSIVINLVLRLAWVETVMHFSLGSLVEYRLLDFSLASLEIIRRGHWNFYRLENEHLNNVGKFRAIKKVPLPFRETDSDD